MAGAELIVAVGTHDFTLHLSTIQFYVVDAVAGAAYLQDTIIQAALTRPNMVAMLGHNVPRVFMLVFGAGAGLAGLAGVIGGSTFVTEPAMAFTT